jgi:hypothetical protein
VIEAVVADIPAFTPPLRPASRSHLCYKPGEQWIVEEPQAPLILKLMGCEAVDGVKDVPCLELVGVDGTSITVNPSKAPCRLVAQAPLAKPAREYRGPLEVALSDECLELGSSLFTDFLTVKGNEVLQCSYGIGCRRIARCERIARFDTGCYLPLATYACAYAPCRLRVRRSLTLRTLWVCIGCRNRYYMLICTDGLCSFEVDRWGHVVVGDGRALVLASRRCSIPLLYTIIVGRAVDTERAVLRPRLRVLGALPLILNTECAGGSLALRAWLWNPQPRGITALLAFTNYRIESGKVYYPSTGWEDLVVHANTTRIPLAGYGVAYLELEAYRTLA